MQAEVMLWSRRIGVVQQDDVNGRREHITKEDLLASAGHMNISRRKALQIIGEVAGAVEQWPRFAQEATL